MHANYSKRIERLLKGLDIDSYPRAWKRHTNMLNGTHIKLLWIDLHTNHSIKLSGY
jgi:hypothetical protein